MTDLDEQDRLEAAATPGPWVNGERMLAEEGCVAVTGDHADIYRVVEGDCCNVACATFEQADADFVVFLRNNSKALTTELRALREKNAYLEAVVATVARNVEMCAAAIRTLKEP